MKVELHILTKRLVCIALFFLSLKNLYAQPPGGVFSNLELWLRSDIGFTYNSLTNAEWRDQSPNSLIFNANLVQGPDTDSAPTFLNNGTNFNPGIMFDGIDTGLATAIDAADFDFSQWSIFSVQQTVPGYNHCVWHYGVDGKNTLALFIDNSPGGFNFNVNNTGTATITNPRIDDNLPHIVGFTANGASTEIYLDANVISTSAGQSPMAGDGAFLIGLDADGAEAQDGDNHFYGGIGEVLMYSRKLSDLERQKVQSYLAVKYGITINQTVATNYVSSDGATIWDATANATYKADIFGIGQDDSSNLNQKVSKSVNSATGPILATTQHFTQANNHVSRASIGTGNFVLMGHNNETMTFTSSYNGGSNNRLARIWKVEETGTVGNVYFAIPKTAISFPSGIPALVLSNDTTFNSDDTIVNLNDDGTHYWASINPIDGQYITYTATTPKFSIDKEALNVSENAGTNTFTVVLDVQPTSNVIFNVSTDDTSEATLNKSTLTFTSSNWNLPQIVTVTGVDDSTITTDATTITIAVNNASDDFFDALASKTIAVTLINDDANFTITAMANAAVNENSAYTSVTPVLSGDTPIGTVTYSLSGTDAGDFTINATTGVVSMIARDFENPADTDTNNIYELTLTATDSNGNNDSESWTVTVNNVVEIAGDINGDGTIGTGEIAGDVDGDGTIGTGEITGDINGDGTIGAGEISGDVNGDGAIGTGEVEGDIYGDGTLGNETFGDFSFNMFPNPTTSMLYLAFNGESGTAEIEFYNTIGKSVYSISKEIKHNKIMLDVSNLPSGTYFLNVKSETGIISKKLIIN